MYTINLFNKPNCQSQVSLHSENIIHQDENVICVETTNSFSKEQLLKCTNVEVLVDNHKELSEILPITLINDISIKDNLVVIDIGNESEISYNSIFNYINKIIKQQQKYWIVYSEQEKYEYLRACYYYDRKHHKYNKNIYISGKDIQSKNSFLCAFAEQLVGIGRYFGSDLDGFDDCFDIYGVKDITVYWHDFNDSDFSEKTVIIDILKDRGVNLIYR